MCDPTALYNRVNNALPKISSSLDSSHGLLARTQHTAKLIYRTAGAALSLAWLVLVVAGTSPIQADADVIFSNYGPGDSASTSAEEIGGLAERMLAAEFTVTGGNFTFDTVEFSVARLIGASNPLILSLHSSSGGVPGALLETTSGPVTNTTFIPIVEAFNFSGSTILQENETYFLVASTTTGGNFQLFWNTNSIGQNGFLEQDTGQPWATVNDSTPVFRILGSAVPEPGTGVLFFCLYATFLAASRRRRVILCEE